MRKRQVFFLDMLFVCIIIILVAFSYISYLRIQNLKIASYWVNHSNEIKLGLNEALTFLLDAESGQRGYILTNDKTYERQFTNALSDADTELEKAIQLTNDNPIQQKKVIHLRKLFHKRFKWLNQTLNSYKKNVDVRQMIAGGKILTDSIRKEVNLLSSHEDDLLISRIREKDHANALTPLLVLAFSIIAVILITMAYIRLRREIRLRVSAQDSEAMIRKLQEQTVALATTLERKVDERTSELLQKNIALENMNDELLSFNYVASHDLQEPLRKIRAFISRISESGEQLSARNAAHFERIDNAALRMQRLIEALISYSRANNTDEDYIAVDLNQLLAETKADLRETIDEKKAVIKSDELPVLRVIPSQFQQLFTNLLINSLKYAKSDVNPEIIITSEIINNTRDLKKDVYLPHARYWKISFSDNGIGFEKDYEDKIFELFQRLHGKNEFEGTGIGLAICRKIMQNHDGYIFAEGSPGVGATFNIFFPITYYESV